MKEGSEDNRTEDQEGEAEEPELLPAEELVSTEEEESRGSEVEVLQKELALLEGQLQDLRDRYLRAVANLDNSRKRARREMREVQQRAAASVLLDLLTVVDSFERALGTARDLGAVPAETRAVYDGLTLIYRQLVDLLGRRGVRPISAVGARFDPSFHEAVAQVPAGPEQEEGLVALEVQKGYLYGDQVLRPSKVGVTVHTASRS